MDNGDGSQTPEHICWYGDGFEILEQDKALPTTLGQERTQLAAFWVDGHIQKLQYCPSL